jgi:hypothetical protein
MTAEIEWTAIGSIVALLALIGSVLYNRWLNFGNLVIKQNEYNAKQNEYNIEIKLLKSMFEQYQKDMQHYLNLCELCRSDVRAHHEGRTAEHVTPAMRDQISNLVRDVSDIKQFLMEKAGK